jgi:hypothetical protein
MINSGKVTPHKHLRLGANYNANVPTQTTGAIFDNIESIADKFSNDDSVTFNSEVAGINKAAIAFALDPLGSGYEFYARYGLIKKVDLGYNYVSGVHVLDGRWQFMGGTGTPDEPEEKRMYGSIGLQFSSQKFDFPKAFGMKQLQKLLGFEMKRKDLLIPLAFSNSFGPEEEYGSLAYGLCYGHTWLDYGFNPVKIYELSNGTVQRILPPVNEKKSFSSFGGFICLKAGYKYVYVLMSLAIYHQDYGTYTLLNGEKTSLKGTTYVPALGLQTTIPLVRK